MNGSECNMTEFEIPKIDHFLLCILVESFVSSFLSKKLNSCRTQADSVVNFNRN